jgi:hypothetical protein
MRTLKDIIEQHPNWLDLPVAVFNHQSGEYDFIGGAALCYVDKDYDVTTPVLVFAPN